MAVIGDFALLPSSFVTLIKDISQYRWQNTAIMEVGNINANSRVGLALIFMIWSK